MDLRAAELTSPEGAVEVTSQLVASLTAAHSYTAVTRAPDDDETDAAAYTERLWNNR